MNDNKFNVVFCVLDVVERHVNKEAILSSPTAGTESDTTNWERMVGIM